MPIHPTEIQAITDYLAIHAPTDRADLGFVFGTRLPDPAHIAVDRLRRDAIPLVALTGGPNRQTGRVEAHAHRDILLAAGFDPARIIVEDRSANTLENVTLALPLLAARLDLATTGSILVIAKWYHCRRAIMTLKRHLPPGIRYYTHTYQPEGITPDNWHRSEKGISSVLNNWWSIPRYLETGHLAALEWVDDAYV